MVFIAQVKNFFRYVRSVFEAYGDESTRDTFKGELNYDAGKVFYTMLVALFGWLHYIPTDLALHKYPMMAVSVRAGLTALAVILISLKFTKRFRNCSSAMLTALILYLNFGAAFIAATAGNYASPYIGGIGLVFMITTFATISVMRKVVYCSSAVALFFVGGAIDGIDFSNYLVRYAINDLIVALVLCILLSSILNGVKRLSWERQRQLKIVSKAKSDFMARMSHEIRTPMNAITGMTELALLEDMPPSVQERVLAIKRAGASLLSHINEILEMSKIEGVNDIDTRAVIRFSAPDARVLVVDDIATNLKVAEGLLLPYNMRIDTALSGALAITAAESVQYDLILMDHMMPEMDGIETVRRLRGAGGYNAAVPIVALTANAVSGAREMFLQNGFDDFISKPIDVSKLNALLERWIPQDKRGGRIVDIIANADSAAERDIDIASPDGVDVKLGLARTGGTFEAYVQTLGVFGEDYHTKADEIRSSLESGDMPGFITRIHGLKSAAANIGAAELSDAAKALEMAGKQNDMAFIDSRMPELLADLESLLEWVDETVAAEKRKHAVTAEDIDAETMTRALTALKSAIDDLDPAAIRAASKELRPFENAADVGAKVETILRRVLNGEYNEASEAIETLLSHPLIRRLFNPDHYCDEYEKRD